MEIVRLKPYLRAMRRMGLDEGAMRQVEYDLSSAPESHPVIKGLRGARKARIRLPRRGKSGGARVIYYVVVERAIYLMTAYPKSDQEDLSPAERRGILAVIESVREH